ncbi:MAG TPA: glycosyltransferase family 4 protein [Hymenobacter sp.]|uniref:glycosyltransferase family 4 protein n=1 Tax=Hymenobacter sp. TaxID=1898978 RepID=UPI002D7E6D6D|nr:glycosyltransferase family 4 protein [Hymenobacter sp.]HET9505853.1 glycosyltransferase family 4 protein [Hymenobacter sp.]
MSLPATPPVAVLVLAWDETTPAARVLVEAPETAAPAVASVAVLVPAGPATAALTTEEYLPLASSLELLAPELPAEVVATEEKYPVAEAAEATTNAHQAHPTENNYQAEGATATNGEPAAPATEAAEEAPSPTTPAATEAPDTNPLPATAEAVAPSLPAATTAALVKPALVWQEVRILHFTRATLVEPMLVWAGVAATPAAPYTGNSAHSLSAPATSEAGHSAVAAAYLAGAGSAASALGALREPELPGGGLTQAPDDSPAIRSLPVYPPAELPAAPDAEADATPAASADQPLLGIEASTTELGEEASDPSSDFAVDVSPVQAKPAQLAAPAEATASTPVEAETSLLPAPGVAAVSAATSGALHPAGRPFDAPDLNFQIIQYARRAVSQALAEQPFGVIYAPAWPTWLAAQELRHRSGQPLVLHLAQLAAADDELIDLAAGWVAEIQRQALHRADLILTETPALAQRLRHELALPAHRVRAVPAADAAAVALALGGVVRE